MLTTSEDLTMYDRHDRPERHTFEDVIAFWRVARDEVRVVMLETAGIVAAHVAGLAELVSAKAVERGREWRGLADSLAPTVPIRNYWIEFEPEVPQDDDELHTAAERAAASGHPTVWQPDS